MQTFESALQQQLRSKKKLSMRDKRILRVLDGAPSAARTRKINRWENGARGVIGADPTAGVIDWSKIDWAKLFEVILAMIAKFLDIAL